MKELLFTSELDLYPCLTKGNPVNLVLQAHLHWMKESGGKREDARFSIEFIDVLYFESRLLLIKPRVYLLEVAENEHVKKVQLSRNNAIAFCVEDEYYSCVIVCCGIAIKFGLE